MDLCARRQIPKDVSNAGEDRATSLQTEIEAEAEDLAQTIALITQPDAAGAAQGLNDNAHGIDRFGYRARCLLPPTMHCLFLLHTLTFPPATTLAPLWPQPLAQALVEMLKRADPPICVGLYARWGSGKTFMISLLKKEFDPSVYEDRRTRQLLQFFEEGYVKLGPEQAPADGETVVSLIRGLLLTILLAFVPTMPYGVKTFLSIICDVFNPRETLHAACAWCSSLKRSCACWKPCAKTVPKEYQSVPAQSEKPIEKKTTREFFSSEKEFIFVDFNAWEYAASVHNLFL